MADTIDNFDLKELVNISIDHISSTVLVEKDKANEFVDKLKDKTGLSFKLSREY